MEQTIKAVLARCNNDPIAAIGYCEDIVIRYPHLASEYTQVKLAIAERTTA